MTVAKTVSKLLPEGFVPPKHVAIIMDGNGRWAQSRGLPRVEGHRAGAKSVRTIVEESRRLGIRYLTLYTFSSENWQRPAEEVSALMGLFKRYLDSELKTLLKNGVRLRAIGDLSLLPEAVRDTLLENQERTRNLDGMDLVLAVSYGGRDELLSAIKKISQKVKDGEISPDDINKDCLTANLYAPDIPDPELLIRTSNEYRISNFLLWQIAYSEIVFSSVFWPDFTKEEFHNCIATYASRERRFGLTGAQLQGACASE